VGRNQLFKQRRDLTLFLSMFHFEFVPITDRVFLATPLPESRQLKPLHRGSRGGQQNTILERQFFVCMNCQHLSHRFVVMPVV
jgi:hypothetical protein